MGYFVENTRHSLGYACQPTRFTVLSLTLVHASSKPKSYLNLLVTQF